MMTNTTLHSLKDISMIYDGYWKVTFWNFTDQKYERLGFVDYDPEANIIHFSTYFGTNIQDTDDMRELILRLPKKADDAVITVNNARNNQDMHITFIGSNNKPIEDRTIRYSINYDDPNYGKWKRKWNTFIFKIKYMLHLIK